MFTASEKKAIQNALKEIRAHNMEYPSVLRMDKINESKFSMNIPAHLPEKEKERLRAALLSYGKDIPRGPDGKKYKKAR